MSLVHAVEGSMSEVLTFMFFQRNTTQLSPKDESCVVLTGTGLLCDGRVECVTKTSERV